MDIFEWDENTPVTSNNLNEMQNILNGNTLDKYSTDEIVIGTWIDNKPLYRKVLVNTLSNENNMFSLSSVGLSSAGTYIKLKSICNGNPIEEDYFESSADSIRTFINQNGLNINLGNSFPSKPCKVITIIEYTKITD